MSDVSCRSATGATSGSARQPRGAGSNTRRLAAQQEHETTRTVRKARNPSLSSNLERRPRLSRSPQHRVPRRAP